MTQGLMTIKQTANFERNLADIEAFLTEADAPQAYDALLDDLLNTVIPNLERFPGLGRPFFNRAIGSAEAANAIAALKTKLALRTLTLPKFVLPLPRPPVANHDHDHRDLYA